MEGAHSLFVALLVAVLLPGLVSAGAIEVTSAEHLDSLQPVFVMFYAPWCGHCKKLKPAWEAGADQLSELATFAKVDATQFGDLSTQFAVKGYPTLKLIKDDTVFDYSGQRTTADFEDFLTGGYMNAPSGPVPTPIPAADPDAPSDVVVLTDASFERLTQAATGATTGHWLVMVYAPWCGHCKNLAPVWEDLASTLKGHIVVAKIDGTENIDTERRFGVKAYPTLLYIRQGTVYTYDGDRTVEALTEFAKDGFQSAPGVPVPAPRSWTDDVWDRVAEMQDDFAAMAKFKKNVLVFTFLLGVIAGIVILSIVWSYLNSAESDMVVAAQADADGESEGEAADETKKDK